MPNPFINLRRRGRDADEQNLCVENSSIERYSNIIRGYYKALSAYVYKPDRKRRPGATQNALLFALRDSNALLCPTQGTRALHRRLDDMIARFTEMMGASEDADFVKEMKGLISTLTAAQFHVAMQVLVAGV